MHKSLSRTSQLIAGVALGASIFCATNAMANVSWVVFDADTGVVLGQDDATEQHAPASLAKMMTLYLTFEALKTGKLHWDEEMPISRNAAAKVRMKLYLKAGETISVRDAVNGMVIVSANDAATVVGEYLGGSEASFGRLMTQRARNLGMKSTYFANPSGLTAKMTQLTTARDMAVLGMSLRRDFPQEYALFSQRSFTYKGRPFNGHNNLMYRYQGVDGIKTGYTDVSGYNLVSSAIINDKHLVGVVLGAGSSRERDDRMAKLLTRFGTEGTGTATEEVVAAVQTPLPVISPLKPQKPKVDAVADMIDDSKIEQGDGGFLVKSAMSAWRVQVGVSPSRKGADELQAKYLPVVSRLVPGTKAEISTAPRGRKVYRVRFTGFKDSEAAEKTCTKLKQQGVPCLAIRN
ncbi:D-alanyl-D-alanine carboxypeptidase [Brucella pituitosa]|uniref:D-alanyl-D-alanine carboxypeptidase n=1 Tax=Brucella pituitosa TaxID=571256 RepID=UPI000C28113E|nr:D-alanyl-D-alanine carboxypeptidase [Brucella pituitosa]PRA56513.1 D-alanyl-D-alanine carboxypeptidase [Ochrobactrum sp. MYb68]PRA86177.1 D-alanyl-D-alanine carboxypeptidase [Ochrobactrum sp. MYb29]TCQ78394.1 D-alanyl-D-alanine carboxypeptidase/D-alanyl-D-alanine carboxypeptidase (penicillin-binding protein 5/6) [Ochrobactrum sp. BH3]MCK4203320.1 D-alanyl-D-alanine carboxypeptidase [Brucella pituitosa]PJO46934.1 D-alanyl-D-alanine carboxypeptidase [Brucella pituitosa]